MSTPATIPIFDPSGKLRDVPQEQMMDAVNAGGKPAVLFQDPHGKQRYVPADRVSDAVKAGGKLLPLEQQDVQHAGFWHAIASGAGSLGQGASSLFSSTPGIGAIPWAASMANNDMQRKDEGRSTAYRVAAPIAQNLTGANVRGMEESANEGDVAGVMGHAAAPVATMALLEAAGHGLPAVSRLAKDALPSAERAGIAFQEVSKAVGKNEVAITPGLSDALAKYQELFDTGGSRSMAVSKLINRVTRPNAPPLTYDEARLFQSNISRLSADEAQRLTPVMKRQVGQISAELNNAVEQTAAQGGKLDRFQAAMDEYSRAKTLEKKTEVLKKYGIKTISAAALGASGAAGAKAIYDAMK